MLLRNKIHFFCIMSLALFLSGCFEKQEQKRTGLFLVNVLDAEYHQDCHIQAPNSINLPFSEHFDKDLDAFAATLDPEKAEVVFYCSNYKCTASGYAAKGFMKRGFKNVWAYEAGIAEWYQKGLPVEGSCQKEYLNKKFEKIELEESSEIRILSTDELVGKVNELEIKKAA